MTSNLKKIYIVTFFLSITAAIPADLFVASMPTISKMMLSNSRMIQLTMTIFILGFAFAQFFYGPLSDYYGRKKTIMVALCIGIAGGVICADSHSISTLIIGRLLQGIGASGSLSIPRAIFRDISSGRAMSRAISYLSAIVETIIAVSPMTGGFVVQHFNWQANFYILIIVNILALVAVIFLLPETNGSIRLEKIKVIGIMRSYRDLIKPQFLFYTLCGCAGYTNLMLYFTISPFLLQNDFHVTPGSYGLLTLLVSASLVAGAIINTRWVVRLGIDKMLLIASMLSLISGLALFIEMMLSHVTIELLMFFAVISIFSAALFFPNGTSGALLNAKRNAGLMSALYGGLQITASFIIIHTITELVPISNIEKLSAVAMLLGFIPMVIILWKGSEKLYEVA